MGKEPDASANESEEGKDDGGGAGADEHGRRV
jgi:hypothetical protein